MHRGKGGTRSHTQTGGHAHQGVGEGTWTANCAVGMEASFTTATLSAPLASTSLTVRLRPEMGREPVFEAHGSPLVVCAVRSWERAAKATTRAGDGTGFGTTSAA